MYICFVLFDIVLGMMAIDRLRWARDGPDLWLRITPEGVEFAEFDFKLAQYRLPWPRIKKWWVYRESSRLLAIHIRARDGSFHRISPLHYARS